MEADAEVVAGGSEDRIVAVAVAVLEIITAAAVLSFDVAITGLDSSPTLHLAADRAGGAARLGGDPDAELVRVVVAAIAVVGMDTAGLDAPRRE
jgi:hypothetical protein